MFALFNVFYTLSLPISKRSIVKSRFAFVILLQLLQMMIAIPFAVIRQSMPLPGNQVGMDANIAFFGLSFILLGIFNFLFFSVYYKDVTKVGKAFALSSIAVFFYIVIAEAFAHCVPFFKDMLDTSDTNYISYKLAVLGAGIILYVILTLLVYFKSIKNFEKLDV